MASRVSSVVSWQCDLGQVSPAPKILERHSHLWRHVVGLDPPQSLESRGLYKGGLIFRFCPWQIGSSGVLGLSGWWLCSQGQEKVRNAGRNFLNFPWLLLWPWRWVGAPGPLPVGAGGWSRLCLPQEASQAALAAGSPCPGLGDGFFPCVLQLGPFIIGKKENDQASRLENKET